MAESRRYLPYAIVTGLYAAMMTFSGIGKITMMEPVVEMVHVVIGVPKPMLPILGLLLIAGAVGLVVGNFKPRLGIYASIGLVLYFVGALVAHLVVGDLKNAGAPIVPLVLAVVSLVLARKNEAMHGT